jgi:hypothetical protein
MTDPKLIEAVARAYAKIADGAVYDAMPPESREMYAKRVMPIITAYEAARGDGVWVPRDITPAMAHALESNYAECIPPSMIHVANWRDAYRAMIAAAKGE